MTNPQAAAKIMAVALLKITERRRQARDEQDGDEQ
jgi:hypothetical protein